MAMKKQVMGKIYISFLILLLVAGVLFMVVRDKEGPVVTLHPETPSVSTNPLALHLADEVSGLRSVNLTVIQKDQEISLLTKDYPERPRQVSETFVLDRAKLAEGPFLLRVTAKDGSFLGGKARIQEYSLVFDRTPPVISVLSRAHQVRQGGSALVVYALSEEVALTGVKVGKRTFPAYRQPSGKYYCLFSYPFDVEKSEFLPLIFSEDWAGNRSEAGFYYYARAEKFSQDRINISDMFLNAKMPQFKTEVPEAQSPVEIFLKVNQQLRVQNRQRLYEFGAQTSPTSLWSDSFLRQPGATMATFGDQRSYYYQGKKIDTQTHLGVDLASVAQSPIKAANSGRVLFAGFYGIYGNCVIIDHGLGLQSLYGHLTRIDVTEKQEVAKGGVIGTSGATGMAGGDHLHFGLILSGVPVNPVEWWDAKWVATNITDKMR